MKKITFLMVLVALSVFSCGEEEIVTSTEILTQREWNLVASSLTANGVEVAGSSTMEACDLDDTYKFNEDGSYVQEMGSNLCYEDDESWTGTWALKNNDSEIMLDDEVEDIFFIEMLNTEVFIISFERVDPDDNITYKFESTFNAK